MSGGGGGGDRRQVSGTEETESEQGCCDRCCCYGDGDESDDDDDDDDDDEDDDDDDEDEEDGCCRTRGCCGHPPPPSRFVSAFAWTFVALAFASVTFAVAYVTLAASEPPGEEAAETVAPDPDAAAVIASAARVGTGPASREFCSTESKDLYWLERVGYVDGDRRASRLVALQSNVSARDVHYVFAHAAHVPWLHACSLESAVRAVAHGDGGTGGRVNAFVVYGIQPERRLPPDGRPPVSLASSLAELTARYGDDRLNVVHVTADECLEWSPFQGVDMSGRPALAAYAVRLVLVWQFGGTSLDAGVVAVRGQVYRATGPAVEYGDRTVSAAAACHAFVYDAMLCTRSFALGNGGGGGGAGRRRPFAPETGRRIAEKTRWWSGGRGADAARPVPEWLVCRGGVVAGRCYYVEADRTPLDADTYVRGFCPAVSAAAEDAVAAGPTVAATTAPV